MSKSNSSRKNRIAPDRPSKPRPNLPLFPHATGRWAKKVRGKLHCFGKRRLVEDLQGDDFDRFRRNLAKTNAVVALGNQITHARMIFNYAYQSGLIDRPVRFGANSQPSFDERVESEDELPDHETKPEAYDPFDSSLAPDQFAPDNSLKAEQWNPHDLRIASFAMLSFAGRNRVTSFVRSPDRTPPSFGVDVSGWGQTDPPLPHTSAGFFPTMRRPLADQRCASVPALASRFCLAGFHLVSCPPIRHRDQIPFSYCGLTPYKHAISDAPYDQRIHKPLSGQPAVGIGCIRDGFCGGGRIVYRTGG